MPHIHIILILEKNERLNTPEEVDEYVSARIPALPPMDDFSNEAHQARRLWNLVTTNMLHDCNPACLVQKDNRSLEKKCIKHFPKPYSDRTVLSGKFYLII